VEWVRRLSIAYDWQDAIIRAAIALKLSNFEETGGIVAALTTSIPEAPSSGRYGLLAEDIHPQTGQLWGNFPQTYSMTGFILTAMRLSRSWEDRYWRG
jgi:GH15 family glucan-1,4-alpha-glucosidase